jgi:N-acetyl-anhydromuramyl-L-alanine amidase AmpD
MNPIAIVLHHSATPQNTSWEQISSWGKNGYADYHFGVDYNGKIYQGCPINQVAAHCGLDQGIDYSESGVYNQNSLAICAIGNFETQTMSQAQINGIVKCIRNIRIQFPKVFLKLHRELVHTACPGKNYPYQKILDLLKGTMIKDVQTTRWSYPAIKKVYDLGIMKGDENGFRPLDKVTREEMAQIITNLLKYLGK